MTELLDRPAGTGDSGAAGDGGGGGGVDAFGVLGLSYSPELTDGQVRRGELLAGAMTDRGEPARGRGRRGGAGADAPVPDAARRAELRGLVAASRRAQGLPPHITDPATLARIADLMAAMEPGADARGAGAGAASGGRGVAGGVPAGSVSAWRMEGRRRFMADWGRADERAAVAGGRGGGTAGRCGWRRGWCCRRAWWRWRRWRRRVIRRCRRWGWGR